MARFDPPADVIRYARVKVQDHVLVAAKVPFLLKDTFKGCVPAPFRRQVDKSFWLVDEGAFEQCKTRGSTLPTERDASVGSALMALVNGNPTHQWEVKVFVSQFPVSSAPPPRPPFPGGYSREDFEAAFRERVHQWREASGGTYHPPSAPPVATSWATLQVAQGACLEVCKAAYKALALLRHPDVPGGSEEMMRELNDAWADLGKRAKPAKVQ